MQTSAHFIAQAFFCQNGDQGKIDDHADGQDYGRPGDTVRIVQYMPDQQFQRYTECRYFQKNAKCAGQDCQGEQL